MRFATQPSFETSMSSAVPDWQLMHLNDQTGLSAIIDNRVPQVVHIRHWSLQVVPKLSAILNSLKRSHGFRLSAGIMEERLFCLFLAQT